MADNLAERVERAFTEDGAEAFVDAAWNVLIDQAKECDATLRRSFGLIIGTVIAIELVVASNGRGLSLLGMELDDPRFAALLLPLVSAGAYFQAAVAATGYNLYADMARSVMLARHPAIMRHTLDWLFVPGGQSFLSAAELVNAYSPMPRLKRLHDTFASAIIVASALSVPVYLLSVYWRLFGRDDTHLVATSMSALSATVIVVFAWVHLLAGMSIETTPPRTPSAGKVEP